MARRREKWNQVWPGTNTRWWHVHNGQTWCNSTDVGLHECAGCHGNSCSWYSAVWIIFMVNYQVGIDIGRCLWKLLAIICIPGFLGDTVYMYMVQNDNRVTGHRADCWRYWCIRCSVGIAGGVFNPPPISCLQTHFWVKICFKFQFQSLCKISNTLNDIWPSTPVLLG